MTENRICWGLVAKDFVPSNKKESQDAGTGAGTSSCSHQPNFKVSEWGPETVDEIMQLKSVREQKSPYGGTMAEIYDQTPKGAPLRFMIEDKVLKTCVIFYFGLHFSCAIGSITLVFYLRSVPNKYYCP